MYYYDYVDSYMVPSWHVTDTGESLIKLIEPYLDGSEPGSNTADAVSGLNWYFRWRGISSKYTAVSQSPATFSKYGQIIRSNRPVLIDLDAHPTYNEHWVVGYGYIIRGSAYYADVNDGWGSTGIIINMSYVGDIVYIVE